MIGRPRAEWVGWFAALVVATVGLAAFRSRIDAAAVALTYLLVVQGGSARGGRRLGISLAIVSFLCFDVFFLPPLGRLSIQDPLNWVVLLAFLGTSILSAELLYRAQAERAAALEAAHRAKDDVLAAVSHDLRTPLTTIKGLAHEIATSGDERAEAIEDEADRLGVLVAQLLDMSRLASGATMVHVQPNEAEDLLGAAAQQVTGRLAGRELRIRVMPGEPLLFGLFDFSQTLRVVVNLIDNAIKYSPADQPIDLSVRREDRWLVFAVSDRGAGVPEGERQRIFEPFYRPPGTAPDAGGAGLGLSIARGIALAQQGSLTVEPREGGGSVFSLRVPFYETFMGG